MFSYKTLFSIYKYCYYHSLTNVARFCIKYRYFWGKIWNSCLKFVDGALLFIWSFHWMIVMMNWLLHESWVITHPYLSSLPIPEINRREKIQDLFYLFFIWFSCGNSSYFADPLHIFKIKNNKYVKTLIQL